MVHFNPHLPNIGKIIKSYSHFIYDSPTLAQIFPKGSIIPSYRRAKNIKELLAGPKGSNYSNNDHSATGCFKYSKKSDLCKNFLKEDKIFYSARTDRYYTIRQHLDCKSKNVIYLATCKKCTVQYVGSTSNEFKVRFRSQKSAMLTNKTTCELAVHLNSVEHRMSDSEFIVIEKVLMKVKKFCLTVFFIHPEEDRQVGRNIGVLQKRVLSSFVFSILFYEETINTYWMFVKD